MRFFAQQLAKPQCQAHGPQPTITKRRPYIYQQHNKYYGKQSFELGILAHEIYFGKQPSEYAQGESMYMPYDVGISNEEQSKEAQVTML